jgi:hypothetical protein
MRYVHVLFAATACGSSSQGATVDAPAGSNTITGTVDGTTFAQVAATYWVGSPDNPDTDTVIYVFDRATECGAITAAGWDTAVPAGTQILELKLVGKTPQTYPATTAASHIPATNESAPSYTVAAPTATDQVAVGGSVTLSKLETPSAGSFASGTFHIAFAHGTLDGAFASAYCASGREP